MANKTIDRKKAIAARSHAAKAGAKSTNARAAQVVEDQEEGASAQLAAASSTDVLEAEEIEDEEQADEEAGDDSEEEEEAEVEETRALEKAEDRRLSRRERRAQSPSVSSSPDYALSESQPAGSRLPNNAFVRFIRSSYRELRMTTWPTRQDTINWSLIVSAVCIVVAVILGAADLGLQKFVEWWISLAH
jgi:preprotein translocase SecE subunit